MVIYIYISIDDCKYDKNWSLKNGNEFRRNILMEMYKYSGNSNRFTDYQDGNTTAFSNMRYKQFRNIWPFNYDI